MHRRLGDVNRQRDQKFSWKASAFLGLHRPLGQDRKLLGKACFGGGQQFWGLSSSEAGTERSLVLIAGGLDIGLRPSLVDSRWTTFTGRWTKGELPRFLSKPFGIAGGTFVGRSTVTGWLAATAAKGTSVGSANLCAGIMAAEAAGTAV